MVTDINWTPIIVGIAAFIVGYLFAFLDRKVTGALRDKKKAEVKVVEKYVTEPSALTLLQKDQQWRVKMDGTELPSPEKLTPVQRTRLIALLTQIRPWVEGAQVTAASPKPEPTPVARPDQPPPQPAPSLVQNQRPPETQFSSGSKSIVTQIDEILQNRLKGSTMENKAIRLIESPGGGANVYIGLTRYEGVDAVPDPEVKAIIRAAISEWENKR